MGISASKKLVPFGLVICNEENTRRYYQIFKSFSEIMNKFPPVIISDEDKGTIAALQSLSSERQFNGIHLFDVLHILRNVKKNLKNKALWHIFNQMVRQTSANKFNQLYNECKEGIDSEADFHVLKKFIENSHKYCLSQIPKAMYGFMPNTSMNEKVHDLIKRVLPFSKPFTVVVQKVFNLLEELGIKCYGYELESNKFEEIYRYMPLK